MEISKKIGRHSKKLFWLNVILLSFYINLLINSGLLYRYSLGYDFDIKNFVIIFGILSIFLSYIILFIYKKILIDLHSYFLKRRLIYIHKYWDFVLFPAMLFLFLMSAFYLIFKRPIDDSIFLITTISTYAYLLVAQIIIIKNKEKTTNFSLIFVILALIVKLTIIFLITMAISDFIFEILALIGQYKSLRSGTWGIG